MGISVCLDLETMCTLPTAVVLTLGAVKFDPFSMQEPHTPLYTRLEINDQLEKGRTVSDSTMTWWSKQEASIRDEAFNDDDRDPVEKLLHDLRKYVVGVSHIYCQGPTFDMVILENMFRQYSIPIPWQYWQIRDCRTLFDLTGDLRIKSKDTLHNALADSFSQAVGVQLVHNKLGITGRKK